MDDLDVILIGSGVMSANLGALLKKLDPKMSIERWPLVQAVWFCIVLSGLVWSGTV